MGWFRFFDTTKFGQSLVPCPNFPQVRHFWFGQTSWVWPSSWHTIQNVIFFSTLVDKINYSSAIKSYLLRIVTISSTKSGFLYLRKKLWYIVCWQSLVHKQKQSHYLLSCSKQNISIFVLTNSLTSMQPSHRRRNGGARAARAPPFFGGGGKDQNLPQIFEICMAIKWRAPPDFSNMLRPCD